MTAFVRTTAPTGVGRISITIHALVDAVGNPLTPIGSFDLELRDVAGDTVKVVSGDLVPQLTGAQQTQIVALMTALRTKANAEAI